MNIRSIVKKELIHLLSLGKPQKKVLFDSFGGTQYSADPRAISEKMHELYPEYEIVWALKPDTIKKNCEIIPDYVRVVNHTFGFIKEIATSAAYVTTEALTESFYKRKYQFVVQTWHGDRGFKNVLYKAAKSSHKTRSKIYDDEYTDLCVAGSDYGIARYREAFGYSGEIIKIGMPRNDKLINLHIDEYRRLKSLFRIPEGYKLLTYAPTFRGHSLSEQKAEIDIRRTLNALELQGEKWLCLLRAHEYSKGINYGESDDRIIDVSMYPDMADILAITDMLITDYSSCAGDFLVKKKPIILAINDEEEYKKVSRTLNVDLNETGYILSHSQEELEKIILTTTEEEYVRACEKTLAFYVTNETGHASEVICRLINDNYISSILKKKKN